MIYFIAAVLFNKRVGFISAFIYACYGIAIFYSGIRLAPSLVIFCMLLFFLSLLTAELKKKLLLFFISGILLGIVIAARPNITLLFFLLPLWFFITLKNNTSFKYSLRGYIFLLLGFFIITSVISARNYFIVNELTPSVVGGFNFYIGNNPDASGHFTTPQGISTSPIEQVKTSIRIAEKGSGESLTYSQASRYWLGKGIEYIKNNPLDAIRLYAKKFALFWRKEEISHNIDYNLCKNFAPLLKYPFISYGWIAPLAILGIILGLINKQKMLLILLLIFSCLISVMIFFMSERYRLPAVPFLIIIASYALTGFADLIRLKEIKKVCMLGALFIILLIGINGNFGYFNYSKQINNIYRLNIGKHHILKGRLDEAVIEIKNAISADPSLLDAHYYLGFIYEQQGDTKKASMEYKQEITNNPGSDKAHNNLGIIYVNEGKMDEAIYHFKKAVDINPDNAMAHSNLGDASYKLGDFNYAISEYEKVLTINPDDAEVHNKIGHILFIKGNTKEAITHLSEALRIKPDLLIAKYRIALALSKQGELEEAVRFFQDVIRIKPDFSEAHNNLGAVLARQGKIDEAIVHFREAIRINPNYKNAQANLENALNIK
jgi:tetratricopeptide (TPR) repeat protein